MEYRIIGLLYNDVFFPPHVLLPLPLSFPLSSYYPPPRSHLILASPPPPPPLLSPPPANPYSHPWFIYSIKNTSRELALNYPQKTLSWQTLLLSSNAPELSQSVLIVPFAELTPGCIVRLPPSWNMMSVNPITSHFKMAATQWVLDLNRLSVALWTELSIFNCQYGLKQCKNAKDFESKKSVLKHLWKRISGTLPNFFLFERWAQRRNLLTLRVG